MFARKADRLDEVRDSGAECSRLLVSRLSWEAFMLVSRRPFAFDDTARLMAGFAALTTARRRLAT